MFIDDPLSHAEVTGRVLILSLLPIYAAFDYEIKKHILSTLIQNLLLLLKLEFKTSYKITQSETL